MAKDRAEYVMLILTKSDFQLWLSAREANPDVVVGLIGIEGSHARDDDLANINILFDTGFRMISLQHFFDNKLGGSLHGISDKGLTAFGKQAAEMMQNKGIIVDVSHLSNSLINYSKYKQDSIFTCFIEMLSLSVILKASSLFTPRILHNSRSN